MERACLIYPAAIAVKLNIASGCGDIACDDDIPARQADIPSSAGRINWPCDGNATDRVIALNREITIGRDGVDGDVV